MEEYKVYFDSIVTTLNEVTDTKIIFVNTI